ncbi:MAG: lipoyl(octanoyl) transferase LipB [Fermentimonas sp.]|nr:lipoyl(octanoyl) transferase LipB [Fermentimonas sp.]
MESIKKVMKRVEFQDLGRIRYIEAWDYQQKLFESVIKEKTELRNKQTIVGFSNNHLKQYLLFCEHEHVFTIGKSGDRQNLLVTKALCESRKIDLHEIDRGGDITYHGPGQLVAYPIIDLEEYGIGIKSYISMLEDVVINTLKHFAINGEKDNKAMGVWIDAKNPAKARKICAIGVRASRFVTMHGLALNVNTDLSYFNYINPCGFTDKGVTSTEKELNRAVDMKDVSEKMKESFAEVFGMSY